MQYPGEVINPWHAMLQFLQVASPGNHVIINTIILWLTALLVVALWNLDIGPLAFTCTECMLPTCMHIVHGCYLLLYIAYMHWGCMKLSRTYTSGSQPWFFLIAHTPVIGWLFDWQESWGLTDYWGVPNKLLVYHITPALPTDWGLLKTEKHWEGSNCS